MYIIIVLHNISSVNVGVVWEADGDGGCGVIARHQDVRRHRREVTEGPLHHLQQCPVQLPVRALHLHHRLHHDTVVTIHLQTVDQRLSLHCPSAVDPLAFVVIDIDVVWVLFEASRGQEVVDMIVCDRSAIGVLWQGPGDRDGGGADPLCSEVQDNCWLWRGGGGNGETRKGKRWRLGEGTVFRRKKKKKKKKRGREREREVCTSFLLTYGSASLSSGHRSCSVPCLDIERLYSDHVLCKRQCPGYGKGIVISFQGDLSKVC